MLKNGGRKVLSVTKIRDASLASGSHPASMLKSLHHHLLFFYSNRLNLFLPQPCPRVSSVLSASLSFISKHLMASKIVAEYAKSGKSSCKHCGTAISKGTLRLGVSTKAPQGFDMTRWHHLDCLPLESQAIIAEEVHGFSMLKESDQDALKKLEEGCNESKLVGVDKEDAPLKTADSGEDEKGRLKKLQASHKEEEKANILAGNVEAKIIAEYAKSGKSSCKQCGTTISKGSLRLGIITKAPQGFDMTKFHHLDCFPLESQVIIVENVEGFSMLKESDQDTLKKLESGCYKRKLPGVDKEDAPLKTADSGEDEKGRLKKLRASHKEEEKANILAGNVEPKIIAEYAKSGKSSCKQCGTTISKGSLRLGIVTKAPQGFDMTKWHHLDCFPLESQAIIVESVDGFSKLKESDQDALKKLESGCCKRKLSVLDKEHPSSEMADSDRDKGCGLKKLKLVGSSEEVNLAEMFSTSDIKDKYKDANLLPKWKAFQTVIFLEKDDGLCDSEKIAAFDFDGCLVKTSVKRVGPDQWSLLYPSIPDKLQNLHNDGYKLVIFTNEANIERWKNSRQKAVDSKIGRLNSFIKRVKVPIQVFIACGTEKAGDKFRKPKPGMWRLMEQHFNSGIRIDMEQSFYVGDAAGRVNDHSDADIVFAKAIGLKFHLPEEFFGA